MIESYEGPKKGENWRKVLIPVYFKVLTYSVGQRDKPEEDDQIIQSNTLSQTIVSIPNETDIDDNKL